MKVLITGAEGQLGRELQVECPPGTDLVVTDRQDLDITDPQLTRQALAEIRPDVVINAAAYTAVDQAEAEEAVAFAINADGAGSLARATASLGARMVQISTDFVFDGHRNRPYPPDAPAEPLGVYGATKLAGERQVLATLGDNALVIRTAWVYSRFGHNFVKTMLRLMTERDEISVVVDQIGSPTWARGLAKAIWRACSTDLVGIHHWTDAGVASWYDFAVAIQEEATPLGLSSPETRVRPVPTESYPTAAKRPRYSVLDTTSTHQVLAIEATHWRRQLRTMLQELHEHGED